MERSWTRLKEVGWLVKKRKFSGERGGISILGIQDLFRAATLDIFRGETGMLFGKESIRCKSIRCFCSCLKPGVGGEKGAGRREGQKGEKRLDRSGKEQRFHSPVIALWNSNKSLDTPEKKRKEI